jgi:hypothetical protein
MLRSAPRVSPRSTRGYGLAPRWGFQALDGGLAAPHVPAVMWPGNAIVWCCPPGEAPGNVAA